MATDLSKVPGYVLDNLRQAEYTDEQLRGKTPQELFEAYCEWHGLCGWAGDLWEAVNKLRAIEEA